MQKNIMSNTLNVYGIANTENLFINVILLQAVFRIRFILMRIRIRGPASRISRIMDPGPEKFQFFSSYFFL